MPYFAPYRYLTVRVSLVLALLSLSLIVVAFSWQAEIFVSSKTSSSRSHAQPTSTPFSTPLVRVTFRHAYDAGCHNISTNGGTFYGIDPSNLPVSIDATHVSIQYLVDHSVACAGRNRNTSGRWVEFETKEGQTIDLFDNVALEDPRAALLPRGRLIRLADGTSLFGQLVKNGMAPAIPVNYALNIAEVTALHLDGGETIFAKVTSTALPMADERLVSILSQLPLPPSTAQSWDQGERAVITGLYSDLHSLNPADSMQFAKVDGILQGLHRTPELHD